MQGKSVAMTLIVKVPYFSNFKDLKQGTELIMEQAEVHKQQGTKKPATWKDESTAKRKKEDQERKKEASRQQSSAPRAASAVTEI